MTKGGSGKSTTLGRLIFGEKRKQHLSSARHRSLTRNDGSTADPSTSIDVSTNKNHLNIHDWAVWRMQLNEQLACELSDQRSQFKHIRQYLQSNSFYQQYSKDPITGRYNVFRLLFSIPRVKIQPELFDTSQEETPKTITNEVEDESKAIRSISEEQTRSVTSPSVIQAPMVIDKTISQLFPKAIIENTSDFLQTNGIQPRRTGRSAFRASDRIQATIKKAVKDGNVLEKIRAFEMQAAAAQAESANKLTGINHRMQNITSTAHRTLSPAVIVHPMQKPISPIHIQQPLILSNRGRYIHPIQHHPNVQKAAHVLEPVHGDIILKRRTPSQKTANDEDYSITAISSMTMTTSQGRHHRHHRRRTSTSRSRHRQETLYDKRTPSSNEHNSHKHQQKQKGSTTPSTKSSLRHRWIKGRKDLPTENLVPNDKQEISTTKSNKTKKKNSEQEKSSTLTRKSKSSSNNQHLHVPPATDIREQTKIESAEKDKNENTNTYIPSKEVVSNHNKETGTIQRRSSKKTHQQKISSTDGEILNKVDEKPRCPPPKDAHVHPSGLHNNDESIEDDVFIEDPPMKTTAKVTRHQSILNFPNNEGRRLSQQSSNSVRRHASQSSADELKLHDRHYSRSKENTNLPKRNQPPITIITRKKEEDIVFEAPHSEQIQLPIGNHLALKKKRSFHTINAAETNNKQISKQILHAIMNSMNNNHEPLTISPRLTSSSINDEFFENGPLTNPEETLPNNTPST